MKAARALRRASTATVHLTRGVFRGRAVGEMASLGEDPFCEAAGGELTATLFRYRTGVEAVRVANSVGSITVLPFQGQQLWDATMHGRSLKMKSMFSEPRKVELANQWSYIDTYGAFFVHCGATSMGCPTDEDQHPVHGELPNAPYQSARISIGEDDNGEFIEVGGTYRHIAAFSCNMRAEGSVRLHAGRSTFPISMTITNDFHQTADLMYMAHTNFRPMEGATLLSTHADGPDDLEISGSVNGLQAPSAEYVAFLKRLATNPAEHAHLTPEIIGSLNPEILVYMRHYKADRDGLAHTMQLLPDGTADYLSHRPAELPLVTRWMVADPSHAALGMALPSTSEPTGKTSERRKGNVWALHAGESAHFCVEAGALDVDEAARMASHIADVVSGGQGH